MTKWIDLGSADDFIDGEHVCAVADGRPVIVCRVQDEFHVVRNECPHAGMPLGDGDLRGHVITCPYHGYAYNVRNGRNIDWPEDEPPVQTFPVRVVDGRVQIEVNAQ